MGKYTKIKADGGPIKKVSIKDKGVVTAVPIDTPEYKKYYDSRRLAKEDPNTGRYIAAQSLPNLEVTADKPSWLTFKEEAEKNYPKSKFVKEALPPWAKQAQQYPHLIGGSDLDLYNRLINDMVAEQLLKNNYPTFDEDYDADRLGTLSKFSPNELNILKNSNLAYKVEPSIWDKFEQGFLSLNAGPVQFKNPNLTDEEAKDENHALNLFGPLEIPYNATVGNLYSNSLGDDYSIKKALQGKSPRHDEAVLRTVLDPMNFMGLGLMKGAGKLTGLNKVLKTTNKVGDVLKTQTPLKNAYKINPSAFKPKMDRYYRQIRNTNEGIGKELAESLTTEGKVLSPKQLSLTPEEQSKHWFDYNIAPPKGQMQFPNNEIVDYRLTQTTSDFPFFQKGDLYYGNSNKIRNNSLLIESKPTLGQENFTPASIRHTYHPKNVESLPYVTNQLEGSTILNNPFDAANIENFNIYEPHWWKGYKQVNPPVNKQYGGYINNNMNKKKYADGGPKKKAPIAVNDLNDPRLKAYADSSAAYNLTTKYDPIFKANTTDLRMKDYDRAAANITRRTGIAPATIKTDSWEDPMPRNFSPGAMEQAWMGRFKKPTQPYIYAPRQEGLSINPIQYNPKDTNPYNKYVVNRYLPTPQSPANPIPYDDIQLYSGHQNRDNAGKSVGYVMEDGKRRDIMADEYNAIMGSSVQGGTKLENTDYAMGGMIKRKDGSYSRRGLWDNIRANKGSGKEPTKEMLKQERKIKAKYADGGPLDTNKLKEYTDLYGFGSGEDSAGDGYDFIYNNLITKHGLDPDNAAKYASAILQPLQNYTDRSAVAPQETYNNIYSTPEDYSLYTGNKDIANIGKYRPNSRLEAKKPFGYGEQEYGKGGPINPLEGDLISKVIMNRNRDKDFVQRAYAVGDYPNSNMFTSPDPDNFGSTMSHKMEYGEDDKGQTYMYPSVMNPKNEDIKIPKQYADYISSVGYKKATGMPYAMGGRMNQAQMLNQGKMRMGSDAPDGEVWKGIGAGAFGVLEGTLDTLSMGATDKLTDAAYKGLQKIGGSDASQVRQQDMIHGFGNIGGAAIGAAVNPGSTMTAVNQGIKGLGQGVGNINEDTQGIGNAISGLSSLTGLIPSGGGNIGSNGEQEIANMAANMKYAQGGLMHINEGGTHEQNALGGVPIGPNALVEQGETINNDFVFSDRLKPKGSKKTYAQLSKSVDTKYRLRPDDKLSKEAKQMDLDRLAMQQEAQKDEMSTKYMQKAMACGGKIKGFGGQIMGPISQSMNVTNGQNTLLAMGGLMSNFMEPTPQYYNPADLDNQYAHGGSIHIKPENRGKFTAYKERTGKTTEEALHSPNAHVRQMANFARNASKWKHAMGGNMYALGGLPDDPLPYGQVTDDPNAYDATYDLAKKGSLLNANIFDVDFPYEVGMKGGSYYKDGRVKTYPDYKVTGVILPPDYSKAVPPILTSEDVKEPIKTNRYMTPYNQGALDKMNQRKNPFLTDRSPLNIQSIPYYTPNTQVTGRDEQPYSSGENDLTSQNPYPEVGNTGYLTNLAGNLVKAGMVATSKPPIYNPSVKFGRMNANPAERLAMQEGRREIQGTKDIIRNNATSSGQYLTNASLMGSNAANKLAGTIGGIRQQYDTQNVGIGNQEAQVNQQITAANNLAKETFRDNRLNQYNKILDSVIGANQQRFATDVHANNYQNQVLDLLKSGDYQIGFDANGKLTIVPTTK